MRQNGPVTGKEVLLPPGAELVSSTDLRGNIQYFNEHFRDICGFSDEELQGAPHNLIRHPHMPEAVFGHLWETIKSGRPWMGIVQNRCKNGDRKSTRLNSSHVAISYAVFCLKKKRFKSDC